MGLFGKNSFIGGALGGIGGLAVGSMFDSPTSGPGLTYNYRSVKDVDLSKENPELWKRIQSQDQIIQEARAMYEQRRKGMTDFEKQQLEDTKAEVRGQLAGSGLVGGSIGLAAEQNAANRYRNQILDRIYNEQQGLFNQYAGQSQLGFNMTNIGQQGVLEQLNRQIGLRAGADQAEMARQSNMLGGLMSIGGTVAGAAIGGPGGALAGKQAAGQIAPMSYPSPAPSGPGAQTFTGIDYHQGFTPQY